MQVNNHKITDYSKVLDEKYGVPGTPERAKFDEEAYSFYTSQILRDARKGAEVSQSELAGKIGVTSYAACESLKASSGLYFLYFCTMTFKDFITEVRPKTLAASSSPVILGSVLAYMDGAFDWVSALLCFGVAMFGQIASNFANDYFDFKNGMDGAGRLGPERVVATGKADAKRVLVWSLVFVVASCLCGVGLLFCGVPWWFIPVGVCIALAVFGYSAGPFPLSHHGLGEVAVLLFFGLIPLCLTYYAQAGCFSMRTLYYAFAVGLLIVNVLVVNNYRDVVEDTATGKRTIIVRFGRKFGLVLYLTDVLLAAGLTCIPDFSILKTALMTLFLVPGIHTWIEMKKTDGEALNIPFGHTARNVIIYMLLCSIGLLFG